MDDQSQINRGAPPATDNSGEAGASQPMMPPASGQEGTPSPDVSQNVASETPSWPSIPDLAPEDDAPTLQRPRGDMPILPPLPQQAPPTNPGMPGGYYPGAPGMPSMPTTPSAPFQPGMMGAPSGYPDAPSGPSIPGAPPYGYPGAPSQPMYPMYPGAPSQPMYPSSPTPSQSGWGLPLSPSGYPAYPGAPSAPFAPSMPLPGAWTQAPRQSFFARKFPFWLSLLLAVGALVLVAAVYVADEVFVHGDWADGARAAGVAAFAVAGIAFIVLLVRVGLGRRAMSAFALGLLLVVILAGLGTGGVAFSSPLHSLQAQTLERNGDWSGAIYEYQLTGQRGPNAPDIARTYDEWGEQDYQQKAYKSAVQQFLIVVTEYGQSGAPVNRAQTDLFTTYSAWVQSSDPNVPYSDAIADFVAYRANPQCDATCQTSSQTVEAQARFQYGEQLLAQQQYSTAIEQFEIVQSQFASSPYAHQAHLEAAKAYYALGQQQLQGTCSDAVPTYQTLAKKYSDTPEGAKAKSALAAPQSVTGVLANYPTNPLPVIMLSRHADPNNFVFSAEYTTLPGSGGKFTFSNVKQGKYNIATLRVTSTEIEETWYSTGSNLYTVVVGPLCPTDFGTYQYK